MTGGTVPNGQMRRPSSSAKPKPPTPVSTPSESKTVVQKVTQKAAAIGTGVVNTTATAASKATNAARAAVKAVVPTSSSSEE